MWVVSYLETYEIQIDMLVLPLTPQPSLVSSLQDLRIVIWTVILFVNEKTQGVYLLA